MREIAVLALLALLVAGCKMGPDYRRPALDIPNRFQNETQLALDSTNTQWWRCFQDPVLDALIAEALANNKNVQIAAANIEEAAAILTQTRSNLFPQVNYGASAARQRISETQGFAFRDNPFNTLQLFAGVNWELDLWGRVRRLSEAARADLLATVEARRGVLLTLVSSVAGSYAQLRGLDEQLDIAKTNAVAYRQSVDLYELQFKYGLVSMMVVEQARTQYETAAALVPQFESQILQTENAICILLGRNPGHVARGKSINELSFPPIPAGLPSQLLERRPDLAQAEQLLVAANARIGAAKALYFPTISLTGAFGFESETLHRLFDSQSRAWNYTGSLIGPIFTAGSVKAQVRQTESLRRAALIGYQAAVQAAFADVENALIVRQKLVSQIDAQQRLVVASREYERLAKLQYDEGYAPYLTVLNAQQQLFPAELNLVVLRASLFTSYANLYKAMGGGWVDVADSMSAERVAPAPVAGAPGAAPAPAAPAPAALSPAATPPVPAAPASKKQE